MNKVYTPFSNEQILELIAYQLDGRYGPFVCPHSHVFDREERHQFKREEISAILFDVGWSIPRARLLPSPGGLVCMVEACGHTKDWVWEWVADGSWRSAERSAPIKR